MRYSASDKIEIIRLVEQSHVPARRALEKLGIPRSSFYRWYDRYQGGGPEALADRPSRPDRVWNRIPEAIRSQIVDLALDQPELSPRELAVRFTDEEKYFVSEASALSASEAHDLITLVFAVSSSRHKNALLSCSPFQVAGTRMRCSRASGSEWPRLSRAGGTIIKTTVDHALMRGLVTAGPVMRRGASSV